MTTGVGLGLGVTGFGFGLGFAGVIGLGLGVGFTGGTGFVISLFAVFFVWEGVPVLQRAGGLQKRAQRHEYLQVLFRNWAES